MLGNPAIMAHFQAGGINEADSCASTKQALEITAQGKQARGSPFDKAAVAYQLGKCFAPVLADMVEIVALEIAIVTLMEGDENCHDLAEAHGALPLACFQAVAN